MLAVGNACEINLRTDALVCDAGKVRYNTGPDMLRARRALLVQYVGRAMQSVSRDHHVLNVELTTVPSHGSGEISV